MDGQVVIEIDGKRYSAALYMASVHDGRATLAVKGCVPISFPVTEVVDGASEDRVSSERENAYLRGSNDELLARQEQLEKRCAKLSEALKPIQGIEIREYDTEYGHAFSYKGDAGAAIREAQRILKGTL